MMLGGLEYETVDVFTNRRFGGNPLAVFPDARGLGDATMQALAAELNLSETTFVLPPSDPANTARVRIFNRKEEMAFAGHPSIGTAFVLARRAVAPFRQMRFEVPAGVVQIELATEVGRGITGARIQAPQPFRRVEDVPPAVVADCLGLAVDDVVTTSHSPLVASAGNPYVVAEVSEDALPSCHPEPSRFRRALGERPHLGSRFSIYVYARAGTSVRARMFAPLAGTIEDPATGSAAAPLAGLLLSLTGAPELSLAVEQGVAMGRPSRIDASARRQGDEIVTFVAGDCVPVFAGRYIGEEQ